MIKIEGLDEMRRKLEELQQRAERLDGEHAVPFTELFPADFIRRFTDFLSMEEMVAASGFNVESTNDFESIPPDQWDAFVQRNSLFGNWQEMQEKAVQGWTARQLGLDK